MQVSVSGFARMTEIIKILADTLCQGNLVFTLEGGYHLEALPFSIKATFDTLLGNREIDDPLGKREAKEKPVDFDNFIRIVKDTHQIKM